MRQLTAQERRPDDTMKRMTAACVLIASCILCACSPKEAAEAVTDGFCVYDLDADRTQLMPSGYSLKTQDDIHGAVGELLQRVIDGPEDGSGISAVPDKITDVTYIIGADTVTVGFDGSFADVPGFEKVLCEAAVVKTLCGLDGVYSVSFTVDGAPLCDAKNEPLGQMTPDSFAEISPGREKTELHLFFASADGQSLIEKTENVDYDLTIPMDRLVVENIISGPGSADVFATVNPSTKINSVRTADGICYVNLSRDFLNKKTNVSDEVMIYSIVNSLAPLENINKVRILIDGDTDASLGEYSLSAPFERNLELIAQ